MMRSDQTSRERPSTSNGRPPDHPPAGRQGLVQRFRWAWRYGSVGGTIAVPFTQYAVISSFHPTWKAKDGDRWHVQIIKFDWESPGQFNCIISHRGWKPKVIR